MHRDHVPSVPKGFELLGSTSDCDVHGFVRFVDESAPHTGENIAVVTLQGASPAVPALLRRSGGIAH